MQSGEVECEAGEHCQSWRCSECWDRAAGFRKYRVKARKLTEFFDVTESKGQWSSQSWSLNYVRKVLWVPRWSSIYGFLYRVKGEVAMVHEGSITGEVAEGLEGDCVSWIPWADSTHELAAGALASKQTKNCTGSSRSAF